MNTDKTYDTNKMIETVEKELRVYFGSRWKKSDISFFIGKPRFDLDVDAINQNVNYPIRDFILRGGKRIRPLLFLTALELFGVDPLKYLDIAALIELIHNGTLVLDDIEDRGLVRRGKPTVHVKFGLDTATNVGMSLHIIPMKILIDKSKYLTEKQTLRMWEIYAEELINVSFGQGLDIYWHKNKPNGIRPQKYLEMVRLKTGSLMRMSLRIASAIGDRPQKEEEVFSEFAESIGMAFQIIDDTLDLTAMNEKFGKAYGNDITEGKLSLPVIYSFQLAEREDRKRLEFILGKHTRDKRLIKEAIGIVIDCGAAERAKMFANTLVDSAWKKLERNWAQKEELRNLKKLTYFLVKRDY